MTPLEIVVIVVASLIVVGYFTLEIVRRLQGKPSINDECASEKKGAKLVKMYRKQKQKELAKQKKEKKGAE